mgnify:CR=1 FL=1
MSLGDLQRGMTPNEAAGVVNFVLSLNLGKSSTAMDVFLFLQCARSSQSPALGLLAEVAV